MSTINNVGSKPVSSPTVASTPEQKSTGTISNPKAEIHSQPLTAEGKAAKASELRIANEVMRQKLQDALGTSGTASRKYPVPSSPQLDVTATPEDGTQATDGTRWDFTKNTDFRLLK